jgi:hypothetical protein
MSGSWTSKRQSSDVGVRRVPGSAALLVVPSLTFVPADEWNISMVVDTSKRWFDSSSRRDLEYEPILTIASYPSGLFSSDDQARLFGTPQIALQVGFDHRSSNIGKKSSDQWTAGRVLTASWKF